MAKFIVDTSIWVDFFRGHLKQDILGNLTVGLENNEVAITDVIRNEILTGARTQADFKRLKELFAPIDCLRISDSDLADFDEFTWSLYRKGLKGKYTDASIAFLAKQHSAPILSFDRYFHRLGTKGIISIILP